MSRIDEKPSSSLLPTQLSTPAAARPATRSSINHQRRLLRSSLRLGFILLAAYVLLWLTQLGDNDQDKATIFHHPHHKKHYAKKYHFEKHMQKDVDQLVSASLESNIVWNRLAEMTDTFGPRIVGSEALEKAIDWIIENVRADNLSVTTEDVVVDYWQRNHESLHFLSPTRGSVKLHILGLGNSVSTPDPINGLEAEIIVAHSKEELEQLGIAGKVKGRVVLWNKPFGSYDDSVVFRSLGVVWAQEHGAVASLVRSVAPFSLQSPHTGFTDPANIPAAAISHEDAGLLERSLKRHLQDPERFPDWPKVRLIMGASREPQSRISRNTIIELKGRERPDEIVVVGGHIDSWDVGSGAVDDGAGCFIAWETIRQLSRLRRPPRRTVRVVFWTSEEDTSAGGRVYAKNHPETDTERHVFAFESDTGVFDPYGIAFAPGRRHQAGSSESVIWDSYDFMTAAGEYFMGERKDLGYPGAGKYVLPDGEGEDIVFLCEQGVACAMFIPADPFPLPYSTSPLAVGKESTKNRKHNHLKEPRRPVDNGYFYYHHAEADTMEAFTPDQLKRSAAVMAIWTYIAAESTVDL
ncbi:MAG: hypothetical protein J3Q66DRAFT_405714 [Benniella sp.]|nr:MAG: hypothetical protein J3Q66DRAFT_405714 [Benniella sp.]